MIFAFLEENLYQLGNISNAIRCLNETHDKEINSLILNALNSQKGQIRLELNLIRTSQWKGFTI